MSNPMLSIVIANYNYGRFLDAAIRSVVEQDGFDQCELIIVDGGSTDNSVEIIRSHDRDISWWVSEKDNGQSDAFNKGFSHARGRLGCWLNADDTMFPGTLRRVCEFVEKSEGVEWISGGTVYFKSDDKTVLWMRKGSSSRFHYWNPGAFVGGPSSFFSLSRLREVGGFDVGLRFTMDSDLWWKFTRAGMRNYHLSSYFWGFRIHAESKTAYAYFSKRSEDFQREAQLLSQRYQYSALKKRLGGIALRGVRLVTGNLIKSMFDSYVWKGICIDEFAEKQERGRK